MAGDGNATIGNLIALAGVLVAIPGGLLAYRALVDDDIPSPPATTTTTSTTEGSDDRGSGTTAGADDGADGGTDGGEEAVDEEAVDELAVDGCVLSVDHIGAQIHAEPSHAARVVASVPDGHYAPTDVAEADWAGRAELWFELTVDGRTGWLNDNTIIVRSKTAACP